MRYIVEAIESPDPSTQDFAALAVPESYLRAVVLAEDPDIIAGMDSRLNDPAKSLRLRHIPTPQPGPGEALVVVMASSINHNTVRNVTFEPVPTFAFLCCYAPTVTPSAVYPPAELGVTDPGLRTRLLP